MADIIYQSLDISNLPDDIRDKLAELDLELSEGDITQKGYEKKRTRLLAPYIAQQQQSQGKLLKYLMQFCTANLLPELISVRLESPVLTIPRSQRNRCWGQVSIGRRRWMLDIGESIGMHSSLAPIFKLGSNEGAIVNLYGKII
ncbi:unnamed protein product [Pieris macdunnoughi]|uniref:DMAP1-binding domain-containing protein n=1 Tax=Pieris macdunnoughi TaxID=345717 RepID=A0A821LBY8_9NEOP|nr:unnamed protein product [Pieris macdunnoughi]